jgi:uncharacterized protein (TIGR02421 family)
VPSPPLSITVLETSCRSLAPIIRELSDRLTAIQRPLGVLEAIRWDEQIEADFFAAGARRPPRVTRDWYRSRLLAFAPDSLRAQLRSLERDVARRIGRTHPAGRLMLRLCDEARQVIDLLLHRGTPEFSRMAARLYGHRPLRKEELHQLVGLHSLADHAGDDTEPVLSAAEVVTVLSRRLGAYFATGDPIQVRLSDYLLADAAVMSNCLKVRSAARFSRRDLRLLEVHEGWTHLGTTRNGREQPFCTFLGRCSASATATQEGLAVWMELLANATCPVRMRRLTLRAAAVAMAEAGSDFLDIYRFFLDDGCLPAEAYHCSARIFRGSLPEGAGPFPKDACYLRGLLEVWAAAKNCFTEGTAHLLPLLFCGKTRLHDLPLVAELRDEGLLVTPRYLPPPFADLPGLQAWLETALPARSEEAAGSVLVLRL